MLFERQKCLLALVDSSGGDVGGLDFQKLLFLYCREVEATPTYEFVPYRFGGCSFTSYADKRRLIDRSLLADEERVFVIYMRQLLSPERTQNYFWWSGLDAEVVQQEFLKAVRNPQPLHLALLPAHP